MMVLLPSGSTVLPPTTEQQGSRLHAAAEFTLDGLHLNGAGYRVWVEALSLYVRSPETFASRQEDAELR
jgi:lysophospholipase L1-like esterase